MSASLWENNARCSGYAAFIFLIANIAVAQVNPAFQRMKKNREAVAQSQKESLTVQKPDMALASYGIDNCTIKKFKELTNIDLAQWRELQPWSESVKTALSDCIIIGTVERVEHPEYNATIRSAFETVAYVNVKEYLRNDYNLPKGLIPIWIKSGNRSRIIDEDTLGVGENVLLFLSAIGLIGYAESNEPALYDTLINDETINFRILSADGKYLVHSGQAVNTKTEKCIEVKKIKEEVKKIHCKR